MYTVNETIMEILRDILFVGGAILLAQVGGRTAMIVVGVIFVILSFIS